MSPRAARVLRVAAIAVGIAVSPVLAGAAGASPTAHAETAGARAAAGKLARVTSSAGKASSSSTLALGRSLFDEACSSCHGIDAQGSALGVSLHGLGAGTVDLWVSSGWMPLAEPAAEPALKPAEFNTAQTLAIAKYVSSLGPGGVPIPVVDLKGASVSEGFSIFALNCAPCHTITGAGDALSNGLYAPPLHGVTATQVFEAVRSGPNNMPRFGPGTISKSQLRSLVAYVTEYIEHPVNPGGLGLGGVGPVAEGFIGLFVGVGLCLLVALWIGDRTEEQGADADGRAAGEPHPSDGGAAHA